MKIGLISSERSDINYLCRLVSLKEEDFEPHPGATRLKLARVFGFKVIVGIDAHPGEYVYFPADTRITGSLLFYLGLYKDQEKNMEGKGIGTFESSGRVKNIRLRGVLSEGYLIKGTDFRDWVVYSLSMIGIKCEEPIELVGTEFDVIKYGDIRVLVAEKYYAKPPKVQPEKTARLRGKIPERLRNIISGDQFRFHYETEMLRFNPGVIKPDSWIWITKKVDGTSGISARILIEGEYRNIYSSSRVIKNKDLNPMVGEGYYGVDVWKEADKVVGPVLDSGISAYYEIIGYLPTGEFIQKADDFGCIKPKDSDHYKIGWNFRVLIYRVTLTTPEGNVYELNPGQVKEWSEKHGLESVKILWSGYARDLYPDLNPELHWSENFIDRLSEDRERLGMECHESECTNQDVPQEGIIIRVGEKAYKLKTEAHYAWKALWENEEDIENG